MFALAGRAVQIMDWDRSHQFCGALRHADRVEAERAGAPVPELRADPLSAHRAGGHGAGAQRRPAPARALAAFPARHAQRAGRASSSPARASSNACMREVREEVGIEVTNLRYFSSQPGRFPHSLMIAFNCDYAGGEITPDPSEIEAAGWFDLDHLPVLPNKISIARRLIDATIARSEPAQRGDADHEPKSNEEEAMLKIWGRNNSVTCRRRCGAARRWGSSTSASTRAAASASSTRRSIARSIPTAWCPPSRTARSCCGSRTRSCAISPPSTAPGKLWPEDLKVRAEADKWMDWQITTFWPTFRPLFWNLVRTPVDQRDEKAMEESRLQDRGDPRLSRRASEEPRVHRRRGPHHGRHPDGLRDLALDVAAGRTAGPAQSAALVRQPEATARLSKRRDAADQLASIRRRIHNHTLARNLIIDDAMLRRLWLAVAWFGVGLIMFLSLTPSPPDIDLGKFSDKYEHIAAYAVLMFWFCQIYLSTVQRGCVALLLVALGVTLEFSNARPATESSKSPTWLRVLPASAWDGCSLRPDFPTG